LKKIFVSFAKKTGEVLEMKKIFIIIFLFSAIISAQIIYEDEQIFNFFDEFNNSQELLVGKNPYATDGIDSALGEEFIPQVPSGQFGVRFQLPPDTTITTVKDFRFGCYWANVSIHLVDLNYAPGSTTITIEWVWGSGDEGEFNSIGFSNPYTGEYLEGYSWSQYPETFVIPTQLDKIEIYASYGGTLSATHYELYSPNGGEIILGGEEYIITWSGSLLPQYMDIEFSSDSGTTWSYIIQNLSTINFSYNWTAPMINSEKCLLRIGNYPCDVDRSDSCFIITNPVNVVGQKNFPAEFSLSQNYPNPFNSSTTISYGFPEDTFVSLIIYDCLGNNVRTLVNEFQNAGTHQIVFESNNLPSGLYFLRLIIGNWDETKKMVLLK